MILHPALKKCRTKINVIFLCGYNDHLHAQFQDLIKGLPPPAFHKAHFPLVSLSRPPPLAQPLQCRTMHHPTPIAPPPPAKKLGYNASSCAFTNNVPVFMQLADVVVCKPGKRPPAAAA
jgi:hypothetical protein